MNAWDEKIRDCHLHDRIEELVDLQEECLEEIPLDISFEDMVESEYFPYYEAYEQHNENIKTIKSELTAGCSLNSINFKY